MLRDLVQGRGCEAGPSGPGNAFGSLAQDVLHGSASKGLQAPLELHTRTSDAHNHARVRCRTSIVARHFGADLGEVSRQSPVPVVTGSDDAELSAFLPSSHQGWAEEFNVAGPSSEHMSRNSTESWVTGFLSGGQEASSSGVPLELEEVWKASIGSGQRMADEFAMEGAWQSTVGVQEDLETAWRAGKQTADWAEEFEDDATRLRRERDAPLNDPDAISWVAEYNGSLLERHRAQPLGPVAHQLIVDLRLSSLLPHDSQPIGRQQAAVEAAVLQKPLAEGLRDLARFRSESGDARGATLAVERLVELGAADADTVRVFLLSCAPDLSPQDVLRYVGPGLLGLEPYPSEVSPPAATDILAELQEQACNDLGREDPSVHFALGLVLDRACTRPDLAVQHYRHALSLLSSRGRGRKDEAEESATQELLLRPAAAAFIALAAGSQDSQSINEALRMAPSAPVTWAALARQQSAVGNWPTAARCALRAAIAAGPEAPRFWEGLAITLCALGRDDLAHVVLLGREQLAGSGSSDTSALESEVLGELKRMAC